MKKAILPILAISMLIAIPVFGATTEGLKPPDIKLELWGDNGILQKAFNWVFGIVVFVAGIMLVWAGFTYITAAGDATKMKKALDSLTYALIGIGVAVLAKGLIYMICVFVGGSTTGCSFF